MVDMPPGSSTRASVSKRKKSLSPPDSSDSEILDDLDDFDDLQPRQPKAKKLKFFENSEDLVQGPHSSDGDLSALRLGTPANKSSETQGRVRSQECLE